MKKLAKVKGEDNRACNMAGTSLNSDRGDVGEEPLSLPVEQDAAPVLDDHSVTSYAVAGTLGPDTTPHHSDVGAAGAAGAAGVATPALITEDDDDPAIPQPVMTAKMRRLMDMAIASELVQGTPIEIIAKNYKLDIRYVTQLRTMWLKACRMQESFDYRHELKNLSLEAIRDGLRTPGDRIKKANVGVRVMQGIGEFKPEVVNVHVLQRMENIPPELRDRFHTSNPEEEGLVMDAEVLEAMGKE